MRSNKIHSDFIKDYNENISQLSNIIFDWNLTNSQSKSELNRFAKKILNNLIEEQEESKIQRIIESELCVNYGLYSNEFNSEKLVVEILNWWNQ